MQDNLIALERVPGALVSLETYSSLLFPPLEHLYPAPASKQPESPGHPCHGVLGVGATELVHEAGDRVADVDALVEAPVVEAY